MGPIGDWQWGEREKESVREIGETIANKLVANKLSRRINYSMK